MALVIPLTTVPYDQMALPTTWDKDYHGLTKTVLESLCSGKYQDGCLNMSAKLTKLHFNMLYASNK